VRVPLKLGSAFCFLAVFGCQASDDLPPGVTVTDSAGVRIVQAGELSSATDTWRIPPEPTFRTGWEEGEPSFQTVGSGELLPDGRVVVADHGANRISWLARDGSVRVTAGREGGGPGELQGVSGLAVRGDTAVVYDFRQSKLAAFVAGAFETERRWAAVRRFLWELAGSFPDGGYLMLPNGYRPDGSESPGWVEAPVIRIAGDLTTADTVASLPLLEISEAGATSSGRPGRIVVTGRGLAHGYPDRTEARWLKLTGELERIVRWDAGAPSVSRAEFERRTMKAVEELVDRRIAVAQADGVESFHRPAVVGHRGAELPVGVVRDHDQRAAHAIALPELPGIGDAEGRGLQQGLGDAVDVQALGDAEAEVHVAAADRPPQGLGATRRQQGCEVARDHASTAGIAEPGHQAAEIGGEARDRQRDQRPGGEDRAVAVQPQARRSGQDVAAHANCPSTNTRRGLVSPRHRLSCGVTSRSSRQPGRHRSW